MAQVAFATRKFMQTRCQRNIVDSLATDDPPPTLRECLENWVAAMEAFDADDTILGNVALRINLYDFQKNPKTIVKQLEDELLGGASLRVPRAAFDRVSQRDVDEAYFAEWQTWPRHDHEAQIPGRVANDVRDVETDGDDDDADDEASAPKCRDGLRPRDIPQKPQEAEFEDVCWLQDEAGAAEIAADFGDVFRRFGFDVWPHPDL